jgi:hypothetical protein
LADRRVFRQRADHCHLLLGAEDVGHALSLYVHTCITETRACQ